MLPTTTLSTWLIAAAATLCVIVRPFPKIPQAVWAVSGALLLCVFGLLPWHQGMAAVGKGGDVYLFLSGMMLASELARHEGLFDYVAAVAARRANGSAARLFLLIYCVGTVVTILMSNDATAVVLTPAVLAATRAAKADEPLPYLYICAFIANAASFVLPISNPANLVIFQAHMPALLSWFARFAIPSLLSIVLTYGVLYLVWRKTLAQPLEKNIEVPPLSPAGKLTGYGIGAMAIVMLVASGCGVSLGWPTFAAGAALYIAVCARHRRLMVAPLGEISWSVLPLVAGLFVLVEGLQQTGVIAAFARVLQQAAQQAPGQTGWAAGVGVALLSNLINNLPAGLIAGSAAALGHLPTPVSSAMAIGIDLGPNLSVTGSLATILWITALQREKLNVGAISFLKMGAMVMFPALIAALAGLSLGNFFS